MQLIYRKDYKNHLERLRAQFAVVAVVGPRQAGKTTLVREALSDFEYLDLELPSDFERLASDPELYLRSRKRPVIIDEAQRFPKLFPIVRALTDRNPQKKGQVVLLGSASFSLSAQINESLSGRVGFLDLTPLLLPEVVHRIDFSSHWLKGGFPEALLPGDTNQLQFIWFENYTRTLIERDLPSLGIDLDPIQFRKLWAMCTHFHAQILNKNKIATSLGISPHTVDRYLRILEQTFAIRQLSPYFANTKKRLVKSPKLFFRDSGVFHYFQRITNSESLLSHPDRGASFEGYVIEQLIQIAALKSKGTEAFYFRTSDEIEVDLILVTGEEVTAFEIKSKLSPSKEDVRGLLKAREIIPIQRAYVIGLGEDRYPIAEGIEAVGIRSIASSLFDMMW